MKWESRKLRIPCILLSIVLILALAAWMPGTLAEPNGFAAGDAADDSGAPDSTAPNIDAQDGGAKDSNGGSNAPNGNAPDSNTPNGNTPDSNGGNASNSNDGNASNSNDGNAPDSNGNTPDGNGNTPDSNGSNTPDSNGKAPDSDGSNAPNGNTPDGNGSNVPNGNTPDGNAPDSNGKTPNGNAPDGNDGNTPDSNGKAPNNTAPDGATSGNESSDKESPDDVSAPAKNPPGSNAPSKKPPAPPPSSSAAGGSISGFIWADGNTFSGDTDWDGLYNGDEEPLAGCTVYLYAEGDLNRYIAVTRTDDRGTYIFDALDPGTYVVGLDTQRIDDTKYMPPFYATAECMFAIDWSGDDHDKAYTEEITLGVDESVTQINAGMRAAAPSTRGSSYEIDCTSIASYGATGKGYTFNGNTFILTFDSSSSGNTYTILRKNANGSAIRGFVFLAGAEPASVTFKGFPSAMLSEGVKLPSSGFNTPLTFINVELGKDLVMPSGYNMENLTIKGLTVPKLTLTSASNAGTITFNGLKVTASGNGNLAYPAGFNGPIVIGGNFSIAGNTHFPANYSGPITIGSENGEFTEVQHICKSVDKPQNGANTVIIPDSISTITINNAKTSASGALYITVKVGDNFNILLAGDSAVNGYIQVPLNTKLTIDSATRTGSEDGKFAITSNSNRPCIGSSASSGQIIINGGTIEAKQTYDWGYDCPAAIGGSAGSSNTGDVTINGGKVTAFGNEYGAAIGGGYGGTGKVTINGGTVTATAGMIDLIYFGTCTGEGAAIGGGANGVGNVTINGGVVTAYSNLGAGIGNGCDTNHSSMVVAGSVKITGGIIRGYTNCGSNIGRGFNQNGNTPTFSISKEADILMYARATQNQPPAIACTGANGSDGYFVSLFFMDASQSSTSGQMQIRGDLYVYPKDKRDTLVRYLPIDNKNVYMSVVFSTGHAYQEYFNIYIDYTYNVGNNYVGLRQIRHFYKHVSTGEFGTDIDIPSVKEMNAYDHQFAPPTSKYSALLVHMNTGNPTYWIITEYYVDKAGNPVKDANGKSMNAIAMDKGGTYTGKPPAIPKYDYKGYKWDSYASGNAITPNNPTLNNVTGNKTVYMVYDLSPTTIDVAVSKTVAGNYANKSKSFTFTAYLRNSNGTPLSGQYAYVGSSIPGVPAPTNGTLTFNSSGTATFTLKHGQTITIKAVPNNAQIRFAETAAKDYDPSYSINGATPITTADTGFTPLTPSSGTTLQTFSFKNTRKDKPITGISDDPLAALMLPLIAAILVASTTLISWRIRKRVTAKNSG